MKFHPDFNRTLLIRTIRPNKFYLQNMDIVKHRSENESQKYISPLPFKYYFFPCGLLAVIGLLSSIYLSISHYRVYTDIGYSSFCALSKAINCDTVSQSPYSIFLGMPLPIWGGLGYVIFLAGFTVAGLPQFRPTRLWRLLFLAAALYSVISILLAAISSFLIHSYCVMCIVTYGVNFGLLFYTWLIPRRFDVDSFVSGLKTDLRTLMVRKRLIWGWAGVFALAIALFWGFIPSYWQFTPPANASDVSSGWTEDRHHWIGAANPEVTIIEFADYRCFQCKKMHYHLRSIINRYPDRIRLVHRHYPMDHSVNPVVKEPFHEGSAALSMLAIQAGLEGKFWEANDALFQSAGRSDPVNTADLAAQIGVPAKSLVKAFNDPQTYNRLIRDIRDGMKLGITGTPTYVINGITYEGQIPPKVFSDILAGKL